MNMMINLKKYCLINLILFSALFSRGLTLDEIINVSNNFIIERSDYEFTIDSINLESLNDYSLFYVIDLNPLGFLLLSANHETIPVLGYSFEHEFNPNSLPAQLSKILDSYKENIVYVLSNQLSPNNNIESLWDRYLSDNMDRRNLREVSPLITANWNQGGQWNNMCPGQALVGCVAVAMGQVMYYWANPSEGNGYTAYYHQEYGPISINFEDYLYDFNSMMDNEATEASQLLVYHAGVEVHMDYSHWGSGASVCWEGPSAQHALINHFGYIEETACDTKINYDDEGWFEMLAEHLDRGWPLIYRAYAENDGPGHAWNVDGYQEGGYLHCNWGWGGSSNGYYYLNNLNGGGYNFVDNQAAIVNIFPQGIAEPIALFDYQIDEFSVSFTNLSNEINENEIVDLFWDFGDGNISEALSPTHTYLEYGSYNVSLVITDEFGQASFPHSELIQILDLTGDINFDNAVDVVDIITLINLVLYPENNFLQDADLNEDGILSIIDIILLVNIILDN